MIKAIIIIQFIATVLLAFIPVKYWSDYHFLISHSIGYSIATNLIIANFIRLYSEIYKSMIFSLLVSNVFGIIATWTGYEYYSIIFDRYFVVALCVMLWIYLNKKI